MSILDAPGITRKTADFRFARGQLQKILSYRPHGIALRAATLGNSIFAGVNGISFSDQAILACGGLLTWVKNGGVAGNTSAMMLSRVNSDVPDYADICLIMEGSNDAINSVSVNTHRQNIEAIVNNLISRGITPVIVATAPLTTKSTLIAGYLAAQHALAFKYNLSILDPWTNVIDIATGDYTAGLTSDSVHPTFAAAVTAKSNLVNLISSSSNPTPFSPRAGIAGQAGYCISGGNCLMLTDSNSDGVPDGWAVAGTADGTLTTAPAGFIGKFARITSKGATGNPYLYKTISTGWIANDDLLLSFAIESNSGLSPQQVFMTIRIDGIEQTFINGSVVSLQPQRMLIRFRPITTTAIQIYFKVNGAGTGSYIGVGEFECYNLTSLLSR